MWRRPEKDVCTPQAPKQDAEAILKQRFPVPRLVDCDQNGSQARFLLAKLNPSATYNNTTAMSAEVCAATLCHLCLFSLVHRD